MGCERSGTAARAKTEGSIMRITERTRHDTDEVIPHALACAGHKRNRRARGEKRSLLSSTVVVVVKRKPREVFRCTKKRATRWVISHKTGSSKSRRDTGSHLLGSLAIPAGTISAPPLRPRLFFLGPVLLVVVEARVFSPGGERGTW